MSESQAAEQARPSVTGSPVRLSEKNGGFDLTATGTHVARRQPGDLSGASDDADAEWHAGQEMSATAALLRAITALVAARGTLTFGLALVTGRKLSSAVRSFFSTDTVRQAGFMGTYSFLYIAIRRYLATRPSAMGSLASNSFIAGCIAGLSIAIDDPGRAHALATYMLSRAAALVCHAGVRRQWWPALRWFPAAVFIACEVPIMYGYVLAQYAVDPDYYRLIMKWSRDINEDILETLFRNVAPSEQYIPCEHAGYHKGPCTQYLLYDLLQNWLITAKMYVPIYCLPRVTLSADRTLANPVSTIKRTIRDIFNSGMMLATYIFMMKAAFCASRRYADVKKGGPVSLFFLITGGLASGLGVLWEPPSRQEELSIYVVPQSLTVVWNVLRRRKWVVPIPAASVVMFSVAMGFIMHHFDDSRKSRSSLKPYVRIPLERVIDGPLIGPSNRGRGNKPTKAQKSL